MSADKSLWVIEQWRNSYKVSICSLVISIHYGIDIVLPSLPTTGRKASPAQAQSTYYPDPA